MADDKPSKQMPPETLEFRPSDLPPKDSFTVNSTALNTTDGSKLVVEANKAKQVPAEFRSKDGHDIQLF